MREAIRDIDRLHHIKERIGHVMEFLEGKTFEDMKADVMCFHAVVYNIIRHFFSHISSAKLHHYYRNNHQNLPHDFLRSLGLYAALE